MEKSISIEFLINTLKNIYLFQNLPEHFIRKLSESVTINKFPLNTTIINKGEEGNTMFVIISGKVKIHDGNENIAEIKEGNFFGEMSLIDDEPRSMSVTTIEDTSVAILQRDDFSNALNNFPDILKNIIHKLIQKLRTQNSTLIDQLRGREKELNELVNKRTEELAAKNVQLTNAIENLQKSQQQLIQQEKLASLGQLTAGIAHEIKNPLNFVNNFSQLSLEILEEFKESKDEEEKNEILSDIKSNLEKINNHGKRADSIVKNMLNHSRNRNEERQLTDINKLCEEYLNLAYNGMFAKNSDFSCFIFKNLSPELPKIKVFSQEITRVLVNLFNNSMYAVNARKNYGEVNYKPIVEVSTSFIKNEVVIEIKDTGIGIPKEIQDKIFEPFFTTKPTGEGTGLGLSLSYDIITQSHNGKITVESELGQYTKFTITIPTL